MDYLERNNRRIAYRHQPGKGPGVIFMGGFRSDMTGTKAVALEAFCMERGLPYVRFDYRGHGQSSGIFEDLTIGDWKDDALTVLDELTQGPQILVGSSMGGWIMLLLALMRPERVKALVGIASAPDFTEDLLWQKLSEAKRQEMQTHGVIHVPSCYGEDPYPITMKLVEEGRNHLLLNHPIPIHCPVRLLHGMQDEDVPHSVSLKLAERLESGDVHVTLAKDAGHRFSEPEQLELVRQALTEICP